MTLIVQPSVLIMILLVGLFIGAGLGWYAGRRVKL